jgi:exodeoxyribonuclease X
MNACVLDTETTGFDEPQPVEIAWVRLEGPQGLRTLDMCCCRYKPSKPITLGALATHHILDEDLENCEPYTAFKLPDGIDYLIGHNVDFDWDAIGKPNVKRIDTLAFSRKLWPKADSHSLGAMMYLLDRENARSLLRHAHSAAHDASNTVRLLGNILRALGEPMTWEAVWLLSEDARVPDVMPFGKHKGVAIADVPADYKRWLLGQPDVDPYLRKALIA